MNKKFTNNLLLFSIPLIIFLLVIYKNNKLIENKVSLNILTYTTAEYKQGSLIGIAATTTYTITYLLIYIFSLNRKPETLKNEHNNKNQVIDNAESNYIMNEDENIIENNDSEDLNYEYFMNRDIRDIKPTLSVPYRYVNNTSRNQTTDKSNSNEYNNDKNVNDNYNDVNNHNDWYEDKNEKDWN